MKRQIKSKQRKIKRNPKFSLTNLHSKWNSNISYEQIQDALIELYEEIANDLRIRSIKDDRFLDYAGDALSDAKVPRELIDKSIKWLKKGALENIKRNPTVQIETELKSELISEIKYLSNTINKSDIKSLSLNNLTHIRNSLQDIINQMSPFINY